MADPRVLVLRAAGVNCNEETAFAFERAGAETRQVHVNRLIERPALLDDFGAVAVPGGFSYGDDISAGQVLAIEIGKTLGDAFRSLIDRGGLVLGICNGFQVLIKSGLLPGPETDAEPIRATLTENESRRYEDRWVRLQPDATLCKFLEDEEPIEIPAAHAEGRFTVRDAVDLGRLEQDHRIVFRYVDSEGDPASYPANPNGSIAGIAGICDATGQVLGMMPHPERALFPWQHPRWTREPTREVGEGSRLFQNAVRYLRR
ncbi:MAG: phosphoribosylformylglycinamidine synthase I [Planctomycetes bacterium]|nr:phosphoribosylformylglycinamidine synthase I [Planctomycetota bacterium]